MNNAHLKLNSMSEFTALWNSGERFRKFAEQVYRYLERMKPGTVLALERYSGEQLEWIIKTACVLSWKATTTWSMNLTKTIRPSCTAIYPRM